MVAALRSLAFLALGSNIGPGVRTLLAALYRLSRTEGIRIDGVSPVFLSEAHTLDGSVQPDYRNAVARVQTDLGPEELLDRCLEIERSLGRTRHRENRWAPRVIDLDILLHSGGPVDSMTLGIPHPRMRERLFVLRPLAELVGAEHYFPEFELTMSDLLEKCPDTGRTVRTIVGLNNFK